MQFARRAFGRHAASPDAADKGSKAAAAGSGRAKAPASATGEAEDAEAGTQSANGTTTGLAETENPSAADDQEASEDQAAAALKTKVDGTLIDIAYRNMAARLKFRVRLAKAQQLPRFSRPAGLSAINRKKRWPLDRRTTACPACFH